MTFPFDPQEGLVIIRAELWGPLGSSVLRLALDTGATGTLINTAMLVAIGYDPGATMDRVEVTTGSGVEFVPRLELQRISTLGIVRERLRVLAHTLPPSAAVDGLIGLDFMRERALVINFREGTIELS